MKHRCTDPKPLPPFGGWGHAIEGGCYEDERGFFWVGNDEYGSPVNFCPFCGQRAPRPAVEAGEYRNNNGRGERYVEPPRSLE